MQRQFMPKYTEDKPKKQITFTTNQKTFDAVKKLADLAGVTVSVLLNDMLHDYLSENEG